MRILFFSIFLGAGLEVKRMGALDKTESAREHLDFYLRLLHEVVDFKDPAAGIGSELFQKI